ncbi:MAG: helix-turn-helix domain-containing protein [Saprospiraceae bacterium]
MFYLIGIILSFFLCLLLLGKKDKTSADRLLAFWMFWIGCHLLVFYLYLSQKIYDFPFLLGLTIPMPLVHPPLLFLYTAALCRGEMPRRWWVHFLPFLGCFLYLIPFVMLPAEQKIWVFENKGAGYEGFMLLVNIAINSSGLIYIFLAHRMLQKHRRVIADLFSNQEKINLQWLQNLIYGLAAIWLIVLTGNDPIVFGAAVLLVLYIGYFGIRQVGVFSSPPALQIAQANYGSPDSLFPTAILEPAAVADASEKPSELPLDKKKYEKSGLTPEAAEKLHQQLFEIMAAQQLYRESELSLTGLAERLGAHPNYLSQIINENEGKNFYDYVNSMRVEAFLTMAADPQNRRFTLFALALECGFNSKTAFNRYFKKAKGQSPSEYLLDFSKASHNQICGT